MTPVVSLALLIFFGFSLQAAVELEGADPASSAVPVLAPETPPPSVCPAGGPLGDVDLRVKSPRGDQPLPLRTINTLAEGDTVLYTPLLRGRMKRPGEVALVLVPLKRSPDRDQLIVTDPKPANASQEWTIESTATLAAFVYGPSGLNKKKVHGFLSQDDLLVAQLADYAEKTAQTEQLIQALSSSESSSASVNAALSGFASRYGLGAQIDRSAPANQQAMTLFQTLNPALATYDPLQPSMGARYGQTAGVATAVATLFFGSPVGLAAGGAAMLLDLRALAFPGAEFRSSFAVSLPNGGLNLCGRRDPAPPHTRVAYLWATRIPNIRRPTAKVGNANYLPLAQKTPLPVDVPEPEWRYLERARAWTLENDRHQKFPVKVLKLANPKSLEIDLTKTDATPGDYHLTGFWDWQPFTAEGVVHLLPLAGFEGAKLQPQSQDKLLANTGKIAATLAGADFEFTTKVELKEVGDEFATAAVVPFKPPKGLREGPQEYMDVQIDTSDLDPGTYNLLLYQQDDKSHPIEAKILPAPPKVENLPIVGNQGVPEFDYVLKGEHLELIEKLDAPGVTLTLGAPAAGQTQRQVAVRFSSLPQSGSNLELKAYLRDRNQPLEFKDGVHITGPQPTIIATTLSPPAGMQISIKEGEFPAGYTLSSMLRTRNVEQSSALRLGCVGDAAPKLALRVGEQSESAGLQMLSSDNLFLSFDTSAWPAGCTIQAVFDNPGGVRGEPFSLGHIIRFPQIENLKLTPEEAGDGMHVALLTGRNLEMIEKTGWDLLYGADVLGLPAPLPGQGQKQVLRIKLPHPPGPKTVLYVWLRGETVGRVTTVPAQPPAPVAPAIVPPSAQ